MKPLINRGPCLTLLPLIVLLFSSCASYELGSPTAQLPFSTLYIETVENRSFAPQAQALLTDNLVQAFLRDGSVRIVNTEDADATLSVTLSSYNRDLAASQSGDTALGRTFDITLEAMATLTDNRTGETYFRERRHSASKLAFVDSGLSQSEYQLMPVLTHDLASRIKDTIVSAW